MPKILSPSDKFQPRGVGELVHPGKCLACGSGNCTEGYVDLGTYFDYEGQMYLCKYCCEEAAEVLGMLTIAESQYLQGQNEQLAAENARLKVENEDAIKRVSAVDALLGPLVTERAAAMVAEQTPRPEIPRVSDIVTDSGTGASQPLQESANGARPVYANSTEPSHGLDL